MVAGRTHFHCPCAVGRGTIVVDDTGNRVGSCSGKKVFLLLDYLMKWDYIGKWGAWSPEVYHGQQGLGKVVF